MCISSVLPKPHICQYCLSLIFVSIVLATSSLVFVSVCMATSLSVFSSPHFCTDRLPYTLPLLSYNLVQITFHIDFHCCLTDCLQHFTLTSTVVLHTSCTDSLIYHIEWDCCLTHIACHIPYYVPLFSYRDYPPHSIFTSIVIVTLHSPPSSNS